MDTSKVYAIDAGPDPVSPIARFRACERYARLVMDTFGPFARVPEVTTRWTVVLDTRAKQRAGQCRYSVRQIGLSRWMIERAPWSETVLTLRHELAHALLNGYNAGHNGLWQRLCLALGGDGKRCFDTNSEKGRVRPLTAHERLGPKYHGYCGCPGRVFKRSRLKLSWRHFGCRCPICRQQVRWEAQR